MKKIYISIISIIILVGTLLLLAAFLSIIHYGSTVRIIKNGNLQKNSQGIFITFNTTYQYSGFNTNIIKAKDIGFEQAPTTSIYKDKKTDSAMKYAFAQIENNKLSGNFYHKNLGKNIKWYSKSRELHVANWVKVWSNYEVEPEDPSFNF